MSSQFLFQFDLFGIFGGLFHRSPQRFTAKPDTLALQILPIVSGAANPVGKYRLGTIAISIFVAFNLILQVLALIEGISAKVVNNGDPIHQTDADLGAKLGPAFRLATNNRADVRMVNIDYPIVTAA